MTRPTVEINMARMEPGEREVVIRWDDDERIVTFWAASGPVIRKLLRLGFKPTHEARRRDGRLHGCEFRLPLERFRWGLKRRAAQKQPVAVQGCAAGAIPCTEPAPDGAQGGVTP